MDHTILIADKDPASLQILKHILGNEHKIIDTTDGNVAMDVALSQFPSLILLGATVENRDPLEMFDEISNHIILKHVPVILLTQKTDINLEEKGIAQGISDYIRKPFFPSITIRKVATQLELKQFRDDLARMAANQTRQLEAHTEALNASHGAIIMGMSLLSESRDKTTGAHLARIKTLTQFMAEAFAAYHPDLLSFQDAAVITTYSPLHDVGKVGVPDAVLKKQGGLTKEEFEQMKAHTTSGGDLLRQIAALMPHDQERINVAIEISECHHERYDGTGYPKGLKGDEIPLSARITAVADIYDALRSPRPYKPGFTHEESMDIMLKGDGRTSPEHFDPRVLAVFESINEMLRDAYDSNPDPHINDEL